MLKCVPQWGNLTYIQWRALPVDKFIVLTQIVVFIHHLTRHWNLSNAPNLFVCEHLCNLVRSVHLLLIKVIIIFVDLFRLRSVKFAPYFVKKMHLLYCWNVYILCGDEVEVGLSLLNSIFANTLTHLWLINREIAKNWTALRKAQLKGNHCPVSYCKRLSQLKWLSSALWGQPLMILMISYTFRRFLRFLAHFLFFLPFFIVYWNVGNQNNHEMIWKFALDSWVSWYCLNWFRAQKCKIFKTAKWTKFSPFLNSVFANVCNSLFEKVK